MDTRKQRRLNFAYTVVQSIDIVKTATKSNNIKKTAKYFGVDPKSICNWNKTCTGSDKKVLINPHARIVSSGPIPEYPDLERDLNEWCEGLLMEGISFKTETCIIATIVSAAR
jgi:hypothetical protein